MKKYRFLFKPLFFIFSLLFASWMVLAIEKASPSDFGRYESLFKSGTNTSLLLKGSKPAVKYNPLHEYKKKYIKRLCSDYKAGLIDSVILDKQLDQIIKIP